MMTLEVTSQFRKDYKRAKKRGCNLELLETVLDALLAGAPMDARYRDHALSGDMVKYRECHVQPDWLLIYRKDNDRLILVAHRTGTHADLFNE